MIRPAEERRFRETMMEEFPTSILTTAIDWIVQNIHPTDVFSEDQLGDSIEKTNLKPDDVFSEDVLEEWAKDNGFIKNTEP
jgi:hypothetical protein